ncbi:MAG: hypothetical protein AAB434_12360 [Planctomycetota bacterium]
MRRIGFAGLLALAVGVAVVADHDRVACTDYGVKVGGERFKDCNVAMSCRFGAFGQVGNFTSIITDADYVVFRTGKVGLPVYLPKNNPALIAAAQGLKEDEEITVLGVVRWSQPTGSYVLGAQVQKGFSCGYSDEEASGGGIVVNVGGRRLELLPSQTQGMPCPHCQNQILVTWEK